MNRKTITVVMADAGVEKLVGVDILPEAARAAERDRPGLYDNYYPADLLNPPPDVEDKLLEGEFNCLTMIAAMGFSDIPPTVFSAASPIPASRGPRARNKGSPQRLNCWSMSVA